MYDLTGIYWIKDEAPYLPEYIEFHLMQGFDHSSSDILRNTPKQEWLTFRLDRRAGIKQLHQVGELRLESLYPDLPVILLLPAFEFEQKCCAGPITIVYASSVHDQDLRSSATELSDDLRPKATGCLGIQPSG